MGYWQAAAVANGSTLLLNWCATEQQMGCLASSGSGNWQQSVA
jgi:hypothetical protein